MGKADTPSVSVIIVTYHSGPVLWLAIDAILAQPECSELLLLDNGNPLQVEEQLAWLSAHEPRFRYLPQEKNVGFARACNRGVAESFGEYVVLLNPDCVVEPRCLEHMLAHMEANPEVWLAGVRHLRPDGTTESASARNFLTPETYFGEMLRRMFPFMSPYVSPAPLNLAIEGNILAAVQEVPAISGALMCIPRHRYDTLGGIDEKFFMHVEDLDLCARVSEAGGRILYMGDISVMHYGSTSRVSSQSVATFKRNGFHHYFKKHFSKGDLVGYWLVRLLVECRFALQWGIGWLKGYCPEPVTGRLLRELLFLNCIRQFPEGNTLDGRRIAVTGATGQVGIAVAAALFRQGAEVIAVDERQVCWYGRNHLHWQAFNLAGQDIWPEAEKLDTLIHCGPLECLSDNLQGLRDAGLKRVIAFHANGIMGMDRYTEPVFQVPASVMKTGEAVLVEACKEEQVELTILRPTEMYGMGMDDNVSFIAHLLRHLHFFVFYPPADGRRSPVHVFDLSKAVLQTLDNDETYGRAYVLSGRDTLTYREMVERIATLSDEKVRYYQTRFLPKVIWLLKCLWGLTVPLNFAGRMNMHRDVRDESAVRDFGFFPRPFLKGGMQDISPLEYWQVDVDSNKDGELP